MTTLNRINIFNNSDIIAKFIVHTFFKRKYSIFFIFVCIIALIGFFTYLLTPVYESTARIFVRSNLSQEIILFDDLYRQVPRQSKVIPVNNYIQIAQSEYVARNIVEKFKLDEYLIAKKEDPQNLREQIGSFIDQIKNWVKYYLEQLLNTDETDADNTQTIQEDEAANYTEKAIKMFLDDMLSIDLVAESDIFYVTVWFEHPEIASEIAKEIFNLVIQKNISIAKADAEYGYHVSDRELQRIGRELKKYEENLYNFKKTNNIGNIRLQKDLIVSKMSEIESEIDNVSLKLQSKRAQLKESNSQIEKQKRLLSSQESVMKLLFDIVMLNVDIETYQSEYDELIASRSKTDQDLQHLIKVEEQLVQLERMVAQKNDLYQQLSAKTDKLNVQQISELSGVNLSLIDLTIPLEQDGPVWPDWPLNLAIGIVFSMFFSFGFALFRESWNQTFWSQQQTEKILGVPLLGYLPDEKKQGIFS